MHRREFFRTLAAMGVVGAGAYSYIRYLEPRRLRHLHLALQTGKTPLPAPLRVLHISDLHVSREVPVTFVRRAVEVGLAGKPDLICLTGDFITGSIMRARAYRALLSTLSRSAPAYACLGNHDGGGWAWRHGGYPETARVKELLSGSGITCLENGFQELEIKGVMVRLTGPADLWSGYLRPEKSFEGDRDHALHLVLSHNPDSKLVLGKYQWDLMLSGHTHGGQLDLPLIGTPFAPVKDHRYIAGLYKWNERHIHISRGVGNVHGMRFNCPPEVNTLDLS